MVGATRTRRVAGVLSAMGLEGSRLDAVVTALALWMVAGVAWDFQIHAEGISFAEEGFFTASHVTFYTAFVAIAAVIGLATYANYREGASLVAAIPRGYGLGVLGVGIFVLGGPSDFLWHSAFGFEVGVEALTSPSHLALVVGATLFLSSPLRATWVREGTPRGLAQIPLLVSATFVAVGLTFFTIYRNPMVEALGAPGGPSPDHAFLGVLWFAAIVALLLLVLVRRFRLAPGALTLVLGLLGLLLVTIASTYVLWPAMLGAGLLGDGLYLGLRDRWRPSRVLRLLGAAVPAGLFTLYFAIVGGVYGLDWSLHVWSGGIVSAGLVGLLGSYVVVPHFDVDADRPGQLATGGD